MLSIDAERSRSFSVRIGKKKCVVPVVEKPSRVVILARTDYIRLVTEKRAESRD